MDTEVIARFHSLEAAAIAVAKLRHEGHFARVCDDAVARIWGPAVVGGVRVVASVEPLPEDVPAYPRVERFEELKNVIRIFAMAFCGTCLVMAGLALLRLLVTMPPESWDGLGRVALALVLFFYSGVFVALVLQPVLARSVLRTGRIRSVFDGLLFAVVAAMVLLGVSY